MPIIDCHVHLNNYHKGSPVPTEDNVERLRQTMRRNKVDHVIAITSYLVNDDRPSAQELLEKVWGDPRIHVVEGIPMHDPENLDLEGVETRLAEGHSHGLKLYPGYQPFYPHDPACSPIYELAAKYEVPVMIHTGDTYAPKGKLKYAHPLHVDEVAVDWPDVTFILCHLGNPWLTECAEIIYKNDNCYADISGLFLAEDYNSKLEKYMVNRVRDTITYAGEADKLLFGTDWPLVEMRPYLAFVKSLKLGRADRDRLLWGNAAKVFGIEMETGHRYDEPGPAAPSD